MMSSSTLTSARESSFQGPIFQENLLLFVYVEVPSRSTPIPTTFTPGSVYLAGFTQARAPHVALIIPTDAQSGELVHIRIDRNTSPNWAYQHRSQKIEGDMFLSSLLKIHDVSASRVEVDQLIDAASAVLVPKHGEFGACCPWAYAVVRELHNRGLVNLGDADALEKEFEAFAVGNRAYARRDRFPNVAVSQHCS